ncbi:hypothetical protein [Effusibacillus pohliae]|uniref:hypothetical protein n=1 Tax=Effusibacillus pohliae TaxID=232270 RepID=UPI0003658E3E|nr:hypothetical protein [Effusibacillus pohliae]
MERFAFILHPLRYQDFARKSRLLRCIPGVVLEHGCKHLKPWCVSHIRGLQSITGTQAEGWFIVVPLTPRMILQSKRSFVIDRIVHACELAEQLGAGIVGLGAFLKIASGHGTEVAKRVGIPVTTGNSYTAASAIEGTIKAALRMGIEPKRARAVVIGATGNIGSVCSRLLSPHVGELTLVARDVTRLEALADSLQNNVRIETDVNRAVRGADMIMTVSSAIDTLIDPDLLKPGAVICDVARPRNVSEHVYTKRPDVLVIDGGVISVPGEHLDFGLNFGFPPKTAEACIAETMMLALERRYECFTLGDHIDVHQVQTIHGLAHKHGFQIAGFRRFEKAISEQELEQIRRRAGRPEPLFAGEVAISIV